nr:MAG TPA: hypothetical protein [Caudoviricetes sp.]
MEISIRCYIEFTLLKMDIRIRELDLYYHIKHKIRRN